MRILLLGQQNFSGFAGWLQAESAIGTVVSCQSWDNALAWIDKRAVSAIVLEYHWLTTIAAERYLEYIQKMVTLPVIVLYDQSERVSKQQLIELGVQSAWTLSEIEHLDLPQLLVSACARQERMTMLTREHKEVAAVLESMRSGHIEQIENDGSSSGVVKILDSRLVEENARLLLKVQAQNRQVKHVTMHDMLTGLASRLHFEQYLSRVLARASRQHRQFALMLLDVDKFKFINDSYGHHMGDLLLKNVAMRLNNCLHQDDFLARLSGDTFAVIISDIPDPIEAGVIAANMIHAVNEPRYSLENLDIVVTTSVGIALYPDAGADEASLLKHADFAMHRAKQDGRNQFHYFTEEMNR